MQPWLGQKTMKYKYPVLGEADTLGPRSADHPFQSPHLSSPVVLKQIVNQIPVWELIKGKINVCDLHNRLPDFSTALCLVFYWWSWCISVKEQRGRVEWGKIESIIFRHFSDLSLQDGYYYWSVSETNKAQKG